MIRLSTTAANEVKRLQNKHLKFHHGSSPTALRITVQEKGCEGLSYQLDFTERVEPGDRLFEQENVQIVVSTRNLAYIDGLTLDYSEDLMGGSFRFHNPNAKRTCGCGHSFAVETGVNSYQI